MTHSAYDHPQAPRFDRQRIEQTWRAFVEGEPHARDSVRDFIYESWERCRQAGVSAAGQRAPHIGAGAPLAALLRDNAALLDAAHHTWDLLSDILAASDSILVLTDPAGAMLEVRGNSELVDAAAREHVAPGYDWSEAASGTNAIATTLALEHPSVVRSAEHFCTAAKIWDCAASPVRDLGDGSLLGIVDVTSIGDLGDSHTLALAITIAHQIEHTLHSLDLARSVQLLNWYRSHAPRWDDSAALLVDRKGRIITETRRVQALSAPMPPNFRIEDGLPAVGRSDGLDLVSCTRYERPDDVAVSPDGEGGWFGGVIFIRESTSPRQPGETPSARTHANPAFEHIITADPALLEVNRRAERMARANAPILLTGETGSGKELFARAIHASSNVAAGPFVAINCGTLTKELATSELLGYEPGAFTGASSKGRLGKFEEADGGTLFLDEIGELPPDVQVHLLRVLQDGVVVRVGGNRERQVRVRIITATHRDLECEAEAERFRTDLYYRLKVLALRIPPLRERRGDISPLVSSFLRDLQGTYGLGSKTVSPELLEWMTSYAWPGNVRELRGLLESMYILSDRPILTTAELPDDLARRDGNGAGQPPARPAGLNHVERDAIVTEIARNGHNLSLVAKRLGISRSTLYRKLKQYAIERA